MDEVKWRARESGTFDTAPFHEPPSLDAVADGRLGFLIDVSRDRGRTAERVERMTVLDLTNPDLLSKLSALV